MSLQEQWATLISTPVVQRSPNYQQEKRDVDIQSWYALGPNTGTGIFMLSGQLINVRHWVKQAPKTQNESSTLNMNLPNKQWVINPITRVGLKTFYNQWEVEML